MPLMDLLQHRHSVRSYQKTKMPDSSIVRAVIEAGLWSPFPSGVCPVRVLWLKSPSLMNDWHQQMIKQKDELIEEAMQLEQGKKIRNKIQFYWRHSEFIFQAPVVLLLGHVKRVSLNQILQDKGMIHPFAGDIDRDVATTNLTVGLYLQNMLLRAEDLGLASCVLTSPFFFLPNQSSDSLFKDLSLSAFVTLGYEEEQLEFSDLNQDRKEREAKNLDNILTEIYTHTGSLFK